MSGNKEVGREVLQISPPKNSFIFLWCNSLTCSLFLWNVSFMYLCTHVINKHLSPWFWILWSVENVRIQSNGIACVLFDVRICFMVAIYNLYRRITPNALHNITVNNKNAYLTSCIWFSNRHCLNGFDRKKENWRIYHSYLFVFLTNIASI